MGLRFTYADARGRLSPWLADIRTLLADTGERLDAVFPECRIDVLVYPTRFVIPELGVNGFAEGDGIVHMKLDPSNPHWESRFREAIPALLCHELHHCVRAASVGYGQTLREALVSEGLACAFEYEMTGAVPFYAQAVQPEEIAALWKQAEPLLDQPGYDHAAWFFGSTPASIARHAGYSMGLACVKDYLDRHALGADQAVSVPAKDFMPDRSSAVS